MLKYTEEQLKEIISKTYGFRKELILEPTCKGLWFATFEVNDIKYAGSTVHAGAVPQLKVIGYTSIYYDEYDNPVTKEYYEKCIKGIEVELTIKKDEEGDWERTGKIFKNLESAKECVKGLDNPNDYGYFYLN